MENLENISCDGAYCRSHEYMESTVKDLKAIQDQLVAGQQQLQAAFTQLAETARAVFKLHERLDKVEKRQWLAIGGLSVTTTLASAGWVIKLVKLMLE